MSEAQRKKNDPLTPPTYLHFKDYLEQIIQEKDGTHIQGDVRWDPLREVKFQKDILLAQDNETILIVGENSNIRKNISTFFEHEQFYVQSSNIGNLLSVIEECRVSFSTVLVDLGNEEVDTEALLMTLSRYLHHTPVVIMDIPERSEEHKKLCRENTFSYLIKPCDRQNLLCHLKISVKNFKLARENELLRRSFSTPLQVYEFYGLSTQYEMQCKKILAYSKLDEPVLITGEPGIGKGVVAQHMHLAGSRLRQPFLMVSCHSLPTLALSVLLFGAVKGAVPEFPDERMGVFEIAEHGTVYLDYIHEMPIQVQEMVSEFLASNMTKRIGAESTRCIDTRVIAGTDVDIDMARRNGYIHEEFYRRITSMTIDLLPLRESTEEIHAYAKCYLNRFAKMTNTPLKTLSHSAIVKLRSYSWPGNCREFKNTMKRACLHTIGITITDEDIIFNEMYQKRANAGEKIHLAGMTLEEVERLTIIETLQACGGNRAETARQLGISEKTIYNKFRQHNIK